MVDSNTVLWGQALAYTFYALAMMAVMAWFAHRVTRHGEQPGVKPVLFYSFVGFLVLGVSLHIITYNTIPWAPMDLNRDTIAPTVIRSSWRTQVPPAVGAAHDQLQ